LVYHRRRGTAIVDTPKGILVVSESGRGYLLPGGNARKGESRRKAAIRELEEETGLKATDVSYLFEIKGGIHKNRRGHSVRTSHKVFLVKTIGVAKPQGEIKHLAYVDGSNSLNLSRSTRRIIERYNKIKNLMLSKNGKKMKTAKKDVNTASKCYVCGKEELLPFVCSFCGGKYCIDHRLPENHSCANLPPRQWKSKIHKQEPKGSPSIPKITKSTLHENCPKCGSERTMITAVRKNYDLFLCMDCNNRWKTNEIYEKGKRCYKKKRKKSQIVKYIIIALLVFSLSSILTVYFTRPDLLTELLPDSNEIDYPPEEPETTKPNSIQKYSYEELVDYTLSLINTDRQAHGLKDVILSDIDSGQRHAENMLENGYLSHWDINGYKPYMRYTLAGGKGSVSENCAWMYNSNGLDPKQAIKELQHDMVYDDASSDWGHRNNTLNPLHNKVSIGIAYSKTDLYLVQDFEDDYISWTTLTLSGQVVMKGVFLEENQTISQMDIYYDEPKPLTSQQLNNYPYASSYDAGMYVGSVFYQDPNYIYFPPTTTYSFNLSLTFITGILIQPDVWNTSNNFNIQFDMSDAFSERGIGVYSLYLSTESDEYLTTLSFWWDGSK